MKLVEETSRQIRLMLALNTKVKSDGNPTHQNGNPMKQVHMSINKSFVDGKMLYYIYKTHSTMIEDEYYSLNTYHIPYD